MASPRLGSVDHTSALPGLDELSTSTEHLLTTVRELDEQALRGPSLLPGWSRAHVLGHLVGNAHGMVRLAHWAATGEETEMYPSREARDDEIEQLAQLSADELADQLEQSAAALGEAFAALPDTADVRARPLRLGSGRQLLGGQLAFGRVRELEIHHVDLTAGYTPAHWSEAFVERTFEQVVPMFRDEREMPVARLTGTTSGRSWDLGTAGPELVGPDSALLAWLLGRSDGDGLRPDGEVVPPAPAWL